MSVSITGVFDAVSMLLSVVSKAMDMIPNYEQRKKKEFFKLMEDYENEKKKAYPARDDNLVGIYRDRLMLFISVFDTEISGQKIPSVQPRGNDEVSS